MTTGRIGTWRLLFMTTVNKLPQVKPDLVRTDDNWENWDMAALIDEIRKWLSRHKVDPGETRKEGSWFTSKGSGNEVQNGKASNSCMYFL